MKTFWNIDVNDFGIFQQQFDNVFVSTSASNHKCSYSIMISCIKIQYFHSDPDTENGGYLQSVLNVNKTKCALRYDSVNRERKKSDANKLEEVEKLC